MKYGDKIKIWAMHWIERIDRVGVGSNVIPCPGFIDEGVEFGFDLRIKF